MTLTRDFKQTAKARARRDATFREAVLTENVECLLAGNMDVGKAMLRNCIDATIGFKELGKRTAKSSTSLIHMLGPKGNLHARNLFEIIEQPREDEGLHLKVQAMRRGDHGDNMVSTILNDTNSSARNTEFDTTLN